MKKGLRKKTKKTGGRAKVDPQFVPVERAFVGVKGVSAGKLFSSYGLKVNGKIFAMFGRGRLVLKLPKDRVDRLVSSGGAKRFEPRPGRIMKEWVALKNGEPDWIKLAQEAYAFVLQGKR